MRWKSGTVVTAAGMGVVSWIPRVDGNMGMLSAGGELQSARGSPGRQQGSGFRPPPAVEGMQVGPPHEMGLEVVRQPGPQLLEPGQGVLHAQAGPSSPRASSRPELH